MELPTGLVVAAGEQEDRGVAGADDARGAQPPVGRNLAGRRDAFRGHIDTTHREHGIVLDERTQRCRGGGLREQRRQGGRGEGSGFEEGFGQAGMSRFLEDTHEIDVAET